MSADLDQLLRSSATGGQQPDPDELWRQGRRRRRRRTLAASMSGAAVIAAAVAVPVLSQPGSQPIIESVGQQEQPSEGATDPGDAERPAGVEEELAGGGSAGETSGTASEELQRRLAEEQREQIAAAAEQELEAPADEETETEASGTAEEDTGSEPEESTTESPGPSPDASAVADPCAPHEGGEMRTFIDVVAPVEGQSVSGTVDLVGCSSVYEGTVMYRLLGSDGNVLREGFTTATAGGPEIGEFRESLEVPADATTLEVYWEDASDGSDRDVQRIELS